MGRASHGARLDEGMRLLRDLPTQPMAATPGQADLDELLAAAGTTA